MAENRYSAHFDGPVEYVVIGDHNTVTIQYLNGPQRCVPFLAPPRPPYDLVGREQIVANLRDRLLSQGSIALVALDGLPGIGKTAVAVELANDHRVLEHFSDGVLWSGLGKTGDVLAELAHWGTALGVSEPDMEKARTVEARARLVHAAIGLRRMLLVIDDAWRIEDALAFKIGGPNCAHVLTSRLPAIAEQFAGSAVLFVPELDDQQARQLLRQFTGDLPINLGNEVGLLLNKLGGLPLSLVLLGTYLRSEGRKGQETRIERALTLAADRTIRLQLSHYVGPLERHPSLPSASPVSLQAIIGVSFEDLQLDEQTCFKALALFPAKPNTFSEAAALHVTDQPKAVLEELIARRLVDTVRPGRYSLHQSLWDFASEFKCDEATEIRFVAFFLDMLERRKNTTENVASDALNVQKALQLCRSSDHASFERGVLQYTPYLMQSGAYTAALDYLRDAEGTAKARKALGDHHGMLLAELGAVLFRVGVYDEAELRLRSAVELATTPMTISGVFEYLGSLAEKRGEYEHAEEFFKNGIQVAEKQQDSAKLSSLLTQAGFLSISRGHYQDAESRLSKAYEHAQAANRPDLVSGALNNWGWAKIKQGELLQADGLLKRGLEIAQGINFQERISALLINLGVSAEKQGNYGNAEEHYREALNIAEKLGSPEKLSAVLTNLGLLAEYRGTFAQAEEYYRRGLDVARTIGHKERMSNLLQNLGSIAEYTGQFDEALRLNTEGLSLARQIGHAERIAALLQERGSILMHAGRLSEAEDALREGLDVAEGLRHRERTAALKACMAELANRRGNYDLALAQLAQAEEIVSRIGHRWHATYLLLTRGEIELARGRYRDSNAAFERALESAKKLGTCSAIGESHFGVARCALKLGDPDRAVAHGIQAQRLFAQAGHYKADAVSRWLAALGSP